MVKGLVMLRQAHRVASVMSVRPGATRRDGTAWNATTAWSPARASAAASTSRAVPGHTHGLISSLLSNTAIRGGEIADSIVRRRAGRGVLSLNA
jgi:hypothetical protein